MNQSTSDSTAKHLDIKGKSAQHRPLVLDSEALFQGAREVRIIHDDTQYRLTITRLNKLILTK